MLRKRGNPNWGRPLPPAPVRLTEFEMQVRRLQLTEDMYASSLPLRIWCEQKRNQRFVPEWLLHAWGMIVDADNNTGLVERSRPTYSNE